MAAQDRGCGIDITLVQSWAVEAGELALARFRHVQPHHKAGGELVTVADREAEALLLERVRGAYPDHAIIGEEEGAHAGEASCLWAIDPIDGTRAFVSALPVWGISIGVLEDQEPTRGVFYLPLLGEMYYVDAEGDAFWNEERLPHLTGGTWDNNALLCVPGHAHRLYDIDFPGVTRAMGSTAANICYVARGSALGAVIGRVHIWDLAAALAILHRVGGELWYLSGQPVDLGELIDGRRAPEHMLAAAPADLERLMRLVRLKPPRA